MKIPKEMLDCSYITKIAFEQALAELTDEDREPPYVDHYLHLGYVHEHWSKCPLQRREKFFNLFLKHLITR